MADWAQVPEAQLPKKQDKFVNFVKNTYKFTDEAVRLWWMCGECDRRRKSATSGRSCRPSSPSFMRRKVPIQTCNAGRCGSDPQRARGEYRHKVADTPARVMYLDRRR